MKNTLMALAVLALLTTQVQLKDGRSVTCGPVSYHQGVMFGGCKIKNEISKRNKVRTVSNNANSNPASTVQGK